MVDSSDHDLFHWTAPKIMIPEWADHCKRRAIPEDVSSRCLVEAEPNRYSFGVLTATLGVTLDLLAGLLAGSARMTSYEYTSYYDNAVLGKDASIGPEHTAQYNFHPESTDHYGKPLKKRPLTLPACMRDRLNWFGGIGEIVPITIDASVSVCVFGICADIVNGFLLPWNAK